MKKETSYIVISPEKCDKEYITSVISEDKSQLLVPPRFLEANLHTKPASSKEKMIGIFSSGSTGEPKCLWNSWDNLLINAKISGRCFEIKSSDKIFILASPWHVAGLSWAVMAQEYQTEWVLETPYIDKIDHLLGKIRDFRPDIIFTVPSVVAHFAKDNSKWAKTLIFGGGAIENDMYPSLFQSFENIWQSYGQSEAGGLISYKKLTELPSVDSKAISNVGQAPKEITVEILDDEIWLTSPSAISKEKYFTGDLGHFDSNNDLHITGRKNSSGGNCNMLTAISEVLHK